MSKTMIAAVLETHGAEFRMTSLSMPEPGPGEVLVRIAASGVNPLDTKIHAGAAAHARHPLPAVLGLDLAGTVEAVGLGVSRFRRGDEVYGMVGGVGGLQGTLAEYAAVDADLLAHKPANLSMREAAALPLIAITAWEGLVDRMKIQSGDSVLIQGGAGGVGHIAVQIARAIGAKVFATGSASSRGTIERLGATFIDRSEPVAAYVARLTDGRGFDKVYDTAGGPALDASFEAVRHFGHVASCLGWGTHALAPLSFKAATYSGVFTLMPLLSGQYRGNHGAILEQVAKRAEAGQLLPILDERHFTLGTIGDAYQAISTGSANGKLVVDIALRSRNQHAKMDRTIGKIATNPFNRRGRLFDTVPVRKAAMLEATGKGFEMSVFMTSDICDKERSREQPSMILCRARRLSAALLLASLCATTQVQAAAPQVRTQAPGFYRMMLGDFEVTALLDGTHPFPDEAVLTKAEPGDKTRDKLFTSNPAEANALLAAADLTVPTEGSINAFLINTGTKLVLIDTGAGTLYGGCCGHLLDNLRAAGYRPDQVDEVLLTHLHADHVGGIAPGGRMAFPNAVIRASKLDADYWLSDANEAAAPSFLRPMFEGDTVSLKPYIASGKFQPFVGGPQFEPGIRAIPAPGHTPGHTFYAIESKGQKMVIWGDVVHVAAIQFPDPSVTVEYDYDEQQAEQTRRAIFADAARNHYWIAAAHISFPGIGHVGLTGNAFEWRPAQYTTVFPASVK